MGDFDCEYQQEVLVMRLPVRIDVSNTKGMMSALREQIDNGQRRILLDFCQTESIDSTALGALIQVLKRVRSSEGELVLSRVGDGVKRVLAITRVDRVFSVCDTVEEGLVTLKGAA